jgi:hypothetical protein
MAFITFVTVSLPVLSIPLPERVTLMLNPEGQASVEKEFNVINNKRTGQTDFAIIMNFKITDQNEVPFYTFFDL